MDPRGRLRPTSSPVSRDGRQTGGRTISVTGVPSGGVGQGASGSSPSSLDPFLGPLLRRGTGSGTLSMVETEEDCGL